MELVVAYIICLIVVGVVADNKNRSVVGWIVLSILISPLLALILVAVLSKKEIQN